MPLPFVGGSVRNNENTDDMRIRSYYSTSHRAIIWPESVRRY